MENEQYSCAKRVVKAVDRLRLFLPCTTLKSIGPMLIKFFGKIWNLLEYCNKYHLNVSIQRNAKFYSIKVAIRNSIILEILGKILGFLVRFLQIR